MKDQISIRRSNVEFARGYRIFLRGQRISIYKYYVTPPHSNTSLPDPYKAKHEVIHDSPYMYVAHSSCLKPITTGSTVARKLTAHMQVREHYFSLYLSWNSSGHARHSVHQ